MTDTALSVPPADLPSVPIDPITAMLGASGIIAGQALTVDNFNGDDNQKMKLAVIAQSGNTAPGAGMINKEIEFCYWQIHSVELTDEKTGEVNIAPRVVLLNEDFTGWHFVSLGVAMSLATMLRFRGYGELRPPIRATVVQRATRTKGRSILTLVPIID